MAMSLINNKTGELWRSFMPMRKEITNAISTDLISIQVYGSSYFNPFNPAKEFEKWAAVEVSDFHHIPDRMEPFVLTAGLYAVFIHKGSGADNSTFQYIFTEWLPGSDYEVDYRPHFGNWEPGTKNNDPDSEEEIWIPIKSKRPEVQEG